MTSSLLFKDSQLTLNIQDDGKGFVLHNIGSKKTLGLFGMKERAMEMGGSFEIITEPGFGTTVSINPYHLTKKIPNNDTNINSRRSHHCS